MIKVQGDGKEFGMNARLFFIRTNTNFAEAHLFLIFIKNEAQMFLKIFINFGTLGYTTDLMSFQRQPWLPHMDSQQGC